MSEEIKNPVLTEMEKILKESTDEISLEKDEFAKFIREVRAKTNYVNTLITQLSEGTKDRNDMAERNHNLLKIISKFEEELTRRHKRTQEAFLSVNDFVDRLEILCQGTDFVSSGDILKMTNEVGRFEIDQAALTEEIPVKVDVDYN